MKSGYKVLWTDHALEELDKAVKYLQLNFTDVEIARRILDGIVCNVYKHNTGKTAAWSSASHVEKARRKRTR